MFGDVDQNFDPQKLYSATGFEIFRCCLVRTLMATNGKPTDDGGSVIRPDIAASEPGVSADGLTWTFRLRAGLRYAPPMQGTQITAPDFIRALEREASLLASSGGTYGAYYDVIAGFRDYADGTSQSIFGLSAPDPLTLTVQLLRPTGDLGYRFSLPATAPIPPSPSDPSAVLGVAQGHDLDYGRHLVSSGPYMFEGSQNLDFLKPPDQQPAVAGYAPGAFINLVRNPSWSRSTDSLRPAYADRIQVQVFVLPYGPVGQFNRETDRFLANTAQRVDAGKLDLVLNADWPEQVSRYLANPALKDQVFTAPSNGIVFLSMNLALPPFDDIHVRRAVNDAMDRAAIAMASLKTRSPAVATEHIAPDSLEGGLLATFEPYSYNPSVAQHEMAASRYAGRDGSCDAPSCRNIQLYDLLGQPKEASLIARDLRRIGILVHVNESPPTPVFGGDPRAHAALFLEGFSADFTNASTLFVSQLYGPTIVGVPHFTVYNFNTSLVGATQHQLRSWGYQLVDAPTVDDRIAACLPILGATAQDRCWAGVDTKLMLDVVPWAPLLTQQGITVVSTRVSSFSFDQSVTRPALDRIALEGGGSD
jgi:peptide/nickel transport system substrate-binding protein